jgi:hypothetical protein
MAVNQKYNTSPAGSKEQILYDYLRERGMLGILEKQYAGIVDNGLINFVFYTHFQFKVSEPDDITKEIKVPLDLLGVENRILNGIVKCKYTQETPIPLSKLVKWNIFLMRRLNTILQTFR